MAKSTTVTFTNQSAFPIKVEGRAATDWSFLLQPGQASGSKYGSHRGDDPDVSVEIFTVIDGTNYSLDTISLDNPNFGYNNITTTQTTSVEGFEEESNRGGFADPGTLKIKEDLWRYEPGTNNHIYSWSAGVPFYPGKNNFHAHFDQITGESKYLYEPVIPFMGGMSNARSYPLSREGIFTIKNHREQGNSYEWDIIVNYPSTPYGMPLPKDAQTFLEESIHHITNQDDNPLKTYQNPSTPYQDSPGPDHPWAFSTAIPAPWNLQFITNSEYYNDYPAFPIYK